jgi:5-formyltetrahydrofolate cyclo-ligase
MSGLRLGGRVDPARKAEERLRARERRRAIPPEARRARSARIRDAALALPEVQAARVVGAYVSVHSEADTRGLLDALLAAGRAVAVPVVTPPASMRFARLPRLDDLAPGAHGIPEPRPPHAFVDEVDVVLVPGLLFTPDGHRLGNGGGYFDRLLRRMPRARRVALAFEEQVVDRLPLEEHDEVMDVLVTDARVVRCPARPPA